MNELREKLITKARENGEKFGKKAELDFGAGAEWMYNELAQSQPINKEFNGWISVEDRLPKKDGNSDIMCLVYDIYSGIICRPYNEYHECWDDEDYDDYYTAAVGGNISHWMPLPNPPKK